MLAEIITIGDEILIGQITDTNSSWLGQQLSSLGIRVIHKASVSDQSAHIRQALDDARKRAELVILTGGLGPTKDDVTKQTLADYFGLPLVLNEEVLKWVRHIFESRNLPMLQQNLDQAMLPEGCEALHNSSGTAPGMWFDRGEAVFVSLPGVPFEMKNIFEEQLVSRIKARFKLPQIIHHVVQTVGIGESFLAKKIEQWENALPEYIKLAYLPTVGAVRLRLSGFAEEAGTLEKEMQALVKELHTLAGEYIYAEGEVSLQEVIGQLLLSRGQTISTAESCTGGYISHLITSVPGSSAYYSGSIISYSNEVKIEELGIDPEILEKEGAVSEACVRSMAEAARIKFRTTWAIAVSGIAGPSGGTPTKPVGTVWIAVSGPSETQAKLFSMGDHRERTIQRSALSALDMLRRMLISL